MADAARKHVGDYDSLVDFFTRELTPGCRPVAGDEKTVVSPVDGRVAHVGAIAAGQIFQIKGQPYALSDLVGADLASYYADGQSATLYLAPDDYHRIHMPLSARLVAGRYIPGERNSVCISLLNHIPGLFAKNERVVLVFATAAEKRFIMVLVGALNVGSIETVFHGQICPNGDERSVELPANGEFLHKGEELGRFNLGSTVILIMPANQQMWTINAQQSLRQGEAIAYTTQKHLQVANS